MEIVLVTITNDLWKHLDQGGLALLMHLDLSAVFNTVYHELLTHCLAEMGIRSVAVLFPSWTWLEVILWGELSWHHILYCGVLQGVILSPMLYNI